MRKGQIEKKNFIVASSLGLLTLALSLALYVGGVGQPFPTRIRDLAETILLNTYNPWNKTLTSYSLNAVSAIIWDYRGLDTIYETTVLLASITCVTAVLKGVGRSRLGLNLGIISKFTTKLVILITMLIAISTAVHGHLTPGGGFQAGAMLTTIVVLSLVVFPAHFAVSNLLKKERLLSLRYITLFIIVIVALTPVIVDRGAYIMQNQLKIGTQFSMPSWFINAPLGGSILVYNILETFAVVLALSYTLIVLLELCVKD